MQIDKINKLIPYRFTWKCNMHQMYVLIINNFIFSNGNHTFDIITRMVSFIESHSLQIDLWTPDNNVTAEGILQ